MRQGHNESGRRFGVILWINEIEAINVDKDFLCALASPGFLSFCLAGIPKNKEPRFHQKAGFLFAETITEFI